MFRSIVLALSNQRSSFVSLHSTMESKGNKQEEDEDDRDAVTDAIVLRTTFRYWSETENEWSESDGFGEDAMADAIEKVEGVASASPQATLSEPINKATLSEPINKEYTYRYSFESVQEFLEEEKGDFVNKNFNNLYGIPKWDDIKCHLESEASLMHFLMKEHPDVLKIRSHCPQCAKQLSHAKNRLRCYHCEHNGIHYSRSVWNHSFFEGSRNGKHEVMRFLYYWLCGATNKQLGIFTGWSTDKVARWTRATQDLITAIVIHDHELIGGPGVVVEIDESKFGKRKYNKGHRVDGAWVFGGVELTPDRRFFAVVVPDRTRATLLPIIKAHIAPGSIIRSDFWKAYDIIPFEKGYDYVHEKVNHSVEYVTEEGVHTNTIEGSWSGVKRVMPVRKRTVKALPGCLFEFIWRRRNEGNLWNGLMRALEDVSYN